jgi:hypothetical protein
MHFLVDRFRELVPNAEDLSKKIGQEFLNLEIEASKLIGASLAPSTGTTIMYDYAV